jgi:hypothetical protein
LGTFWARGGRAVRSPIGSHGPRARRHRLRPHRSRISPSGRGPRGTHARMPPSMQGKPLPPWDQTSPSGSTSAVCRTKPRESRAKSSRTETGADVAGATTLRGQASHAPVPAHALTRSTRPQPGTASGRCLTQDLASWTHGIVYQAVASGTRCLGTERLTTTAVSEWSRHALCCRQPPCEALHAAPAGADEPPFADLRGSLAACRPVRSALPGTSRGTGHQLSFSGRFCRGSVRLPSCVDTSACNTTGMSGSGQGEDCHALVLCGIDVRPELDFMQTEYLNDRQRRRDRLLSSTRFWRSCSDLVTADKPNGLLPPRRASCGATLLRP